MSLEEYVQEEYDMAPYALRSLIMLLKCMIDEAWENGCECGYRDAKRDALMIVKSFGDCTIVKSIIEKLQEHM